MAKLSAWHTLCTIVPRKGGLSFIAIGVSVTCFLSICNIVLSFIYLVKFSINYTFFVFENKKNIFLINVFILLPMILSCYCIFHHFFSGIGQLRPSFQHSYKYYSLSKLDIAFDFHIVQQLIMLYV